MTDTPDQNTTSRVQQFAGGSKMLNVKLLHAVAGRLKYYSVQRPTRRNPLNAEKFNRVYRYQI